MPATPSTLTSTVHLGLFALWCTAAWSLYGVHKAKLLLPNATSSSNKKKKVVPKDKRKVIVITGCDRGFGRLLVESLLTANPDKDKVIVVALCLTEKAVQELNGRPRCVAMRCDVTNPADVAAAKERVQALLAKESAAILYAIVNNAGLVDPGDFAFYRDTAIFEKVMNVNFMGQVRVTQALLPLLLRTSQVYGGRILNLSSVCGASASAGNSAYNASKFAVEGWSDSLRIELAPLGVSVVKVRPGQVSTEIQADFFKHYLKNYQQAPTSIRELYGEDAFADKVQKVVQTMSKSFTMTSPSVVIDALEDMLSMEQGRLKPCYWLGSDAHTMWRALHSLPTQVADELKTVFNFFKPMPVARPPSQVISHWTIDVRNLETSVAFYCALGLEPYGDAVNGQQFLQFTGNAKSSRKSWSTLILLRQDPSMPARGASSDAGMTRLCFLTTQDSEQVVERLEREHGIKPMAPTAYDSTGPIMAENLTAYQDPDGFVVYFIEFHRLVGSIIRAGLWWNRVKTPCLFHWTVNVTDSSKAMNIFKDLGFQTASDQNRDQVIYGLLPAFNIDPASTVIEHIRLCKLPNDTVFATIMEWVEPASVVTPQSTTNALTIAVDDVDEAMIRAQTAGMVLGKVEYHQMPLFGTVLVGTAYVEENSSPVEFCCFTHKQVNA